MDPPIAPAPVARNDVPLMAVNHEDRPRQTPHGQQSVHRQVRYKDRFQSLRERYDQVTAMHEDYERALNAAFEKERKLQFEIDSLLDVWVVNGNMPVDYSPYDPQYPRPQPQPAYYAEHAPPAEHAHYHPNAQPHAHPLSRPRPPQHHHQPSHVHQAQPQAHPHPHPSAYANPRYTNGNGHSSSSLPVVIPLPPFLHGS
ncbi:hypothetical protein HETIRDRAFT_453401 [Heterobasidion irregulare TC 32-1]|uniref:Uncharacterized protein n=1 Tax=Heterobasidion irregulare (strain TC 32-1) TaxID=747525 RepID=W4JZE7_HETIT|nr:uncharacterized protein HETIRDRAFT_453401 [Heterobasidion irregulare TC 32-1]ETW78829.1 hypothetical protein HETIRDRAFT_453401 [Heterobasidion irregulare TC 32-1]